VNQSRGFSTHRRRFIGAALTALALAASSRLLPAAAEPQHYGFPKIKHVVIVQEESRSFDDLFQGFPGADTQSFGYTSRGKRVTLQPIPFETYFYINHYREDFRVAFDRGRNDGFDKQRVFCDNFKKCRGLVLPQYSYVPASETQPYVSLAGQYVLGDRMFASTYDGDFANHFELLGPNDGSTLGDPTTRPWACSNSNGTTTVDRLPPLKPVFPCFTFPTLPDEMAPANVSWRAYFGATTEDYSDDFMGFVALDDPLIQPSGHLVVPAAQFISDVAAGELSDVTWITPQRLDSDLAGSTGGPDWVASVVNAVGESQFWNSTAIFVTWSNYGGFFDHVSPPQDADEGRSFRVPLIVVSPYVPAGRVTHEQYQHGSILKFAEDAFGLAPLGRLDARANSLAREFDFSKPARKFVPIPL
jgi:phospholipase C